MITPLPAIKWATGVILSLIGKVIPYILFWRLGKQSEKLKTAEEALDYAKKGKAIQERVATDKSYRMRIREYFK